MLSAVLRKYPQIEIYKNLALAMTGSVGRLAPWGLSAGIFAGWMLLPIVKQNLLDAVGYVPPEHEFVADVSIESQFVFSKEAVGEVPEGAGGRWKPPVTVAERAQRKLEKQINAYTFSKDEIGAIPEVERSG